MSQDETIQLELPLGEACGDGNRTTIMEIVCDKNSNKPIFDTSQFNADSCHNKIIIKSKAGCPVSKYEPWYEKFNIYFTIDVFSHSFECFILLYLLLATTYLRPYITVIRYFQVGDNCLIF